MHIKTNRMTDRTTGAGYYWATPTECCRGCTDLFSSDITYRAPLVRLTQIRLLRRTRSKGQKRTFPHRHHRQRAKPSCQDAKSHTYAQCTHAGSPGVVYDTLRIPVRGQTVRAGVRMCPATCVSVSEWEKMCRVARLISAPCSFAPCVPRLPPPDPDPNVVCVVCAQYVYVRGVRSRARSHHLFFFPFCFFLLPFSSSLGCTRLS